MKILTPILPIMDTILGDLISLQDEGKITHQTIERVALQWYESERNILRKTTDTGREVAFRLLKEGQRLKHDDVVFISDELAIVIEILPSEVIVLSPKTLPEMARACYEIGNKHSPLFLDGDEVTLPYDKPMFEWLQAAGFEPQKSKPPFKAKLCVPIRHKDTGIRTVIRMIITAIIITEIEIGTNIKPLFNEFRCVVALGRSHPAYWWI